MSGTPFPFRNAPVKGTGPEKAPPATEPSSLSMAFELPPPPPAGAPETAPPEYPVTLEEGAVTGRIENTTHIEEIQGEDMGRKPKRTTTRAPRKPKEEVDANARLEAAFDVIRELFAESRSNVMRELANALMKKAE